MNESNLNYKIMKSMLNIEDIARLRLIANIVLNIQTTDQLSASVQEHLFAGNIVIVGKWLPYDIYDEMGIFFVRAGDLNTLGKKLVDCIINHDEMVKKCINNAEII